MAEEQLTRGWQPWLERVINVWPTLHEEDVERERWMLRHALALEHRVRALTARLEDVTTAKVAAAAVPDKLQYVLGATPHGDPLDPDVPNGPDEVDERFAAKVDADAAEEQADSLAQERLRAAQAAARESQELAYRIDPESQRPPPLPEEDS